MFIRRFAPFFIALAILVSHVATSATIPDASQPEVPGPAKEAPSPAPRAAGERIHRIVLLGPPAAGKSTLGKGLREALGIPHIDLGEIFRQEVQKGTALGNQLRTIMDRGDLVPDNMVSKILFRRLEAPDCGLGYILDGFPRTLGQARVLDRHLKVRGAELTSVILITVNDEALTQRRLMRNRSDDSDEVGEARLTAYQKASGPIEQFYREKKLLTTVNGNKRPPEVLMDALQLLF